MSSDAEFDRLYEEVVAYLRPQSIRIPRHGAAQTDIRWSAREDSGVETLTAEVQASLLGKNIQNDGPAAYSFLLCLGYWLDRARGLEPGSVRCALRIDGKFRGSPLERRRAQFLLDEYEALLPHFSVERGAFGSWAWPGRPTLNSPAEQPRSNEPLKDRSLECESNLERALARDYAPGEFPHPAPPTKLHRQYPVGLFDGEVRKGGEWTPRASSAVDLWGVSANGRTLHLFELKKKGNGRVGIIPEAFYYARLLSYVRRSRPPDGVVVRCNDESWAGFAATSGAENVVMWLVCSGPLRALVHTRDDSPLELLNKALEPHRVEFRIRRFDWDGSAGLRWREEGAWPKA